MRRFYESAKTDDYSPVIRELEAELAHWDSRFPAGCQRVQLAALKARALSDSNAAIAILDPIRLAPNDFPWLADILVLHRAWAFARAQETQSEKAEVERLLAKQRMLLSKNSACTPLV